jgi:hypothetical protein
MHPGETGVETRSQEFQRLRALRIMSRQELGDLRPQAVRIGSGPLAGQPGVTG